MSHFDLVNSIMSTDVLAVQVLPVYKNLTDGLRTSCFQTCKHRPDSTSIRNAIIKTPPS